MAKTLYSFPVESVTGKLSSQHDGDTVLVHRRKCFGSTPDGQPIYGPNETYTYHLGQKWGDNITNHRQLFRQAQQQAIIEMQDLERLSYWQQLFVAQQSHPQLGEKRYVRVQCFIAAQLLKALKTQKS